MDCMMDAYNVVFAKSKVGYMKQQDVIIIANKHKPFAIFRKPFRI